MDDVPLTAQLAVLALLLACSGFFSMAETAMMACNRYRLQAQARNGQRSAQRVLDLLARTDKLLGIILLFNTLINAAIATLAGLVTVQLFGEEKWILGIGTLLVSFLILVFAEITPKVVGAGNPDRLALAFAYVLSPLLRLTDPLISAINLLVAGLLRLLHLRPASHEPKPLSQDELRAVVADASRDIPERHRDILLKLFDLEEVTVDDIMTPRGAIEALDLEADPETLRSQLATSFHRRLPVYAGGDLDNIAGILLQRRLLPEAMAGELPDAASIREHLAEPYFIPAGTGIYAQLQFFQENHQRLGLVVDEYGEILGLVTLEDIVEELIGKFTTGAPGDARDLAWEEDGEGRASAMVEGSRPLREINRDLDIDLPLDGAKTLNGLLLEHFEDIPESGISARIAGVTMEIVQTQDRAVKFVRIHRPAPARVAEPSDTIAES